MVRRFVKAKFERPLWERYAVAGASVVVATVGRIPLQPILGDSVPFLFYFPAVLFAAWFGGLGPALAATALGALASFLWMGPEIGSATLNLQHSVQLGMFLLVSFFMAWLVDLLHASVSSLQNAEKAIRQHAHRTEEVLKSITDGFYIFDRDWRFLYVNPSGARIAQSTREQLIGRIVWELFPDEVNQPGYQQLTRAMRDQAPAHFEYFYPRFGRWFEFKVFPAPEGLAMYVSDITEKRNLQDAVQQELERRVEEKTAELLSKNESLEALTYSLAHDLRAPMRAVAGYTSVLLEEFSEQLGVEGQQYGSRILGAAKHAEKLMNDLLEYGRLAHMPLPLADVDSQAITETVLRRMAQDIREHGARVRVKGPLPIVRANGTVLDEALGNLIGNALKYTSDGESPMVHISAEARGNMARITVEDYGTGISQENLSRLFKPFQRLDAKKPGSGLGLSIVAKGIERMGGKVGVESSVGRGSRFWIELPKA